MTNPFDDDEEFLASGVIYKPCKYCGSLDYDQADCKDPQDDPETGNMIFEPETCDQCGFGNVKSVGYLLH